MKNNINKKIKVGKLYNIEIPPGKRLIFGDTEYYDDDIFLMLEKPKAVSDGVTDNSWYEVKVLVRENVLNIQFLKHQITHFKEVKQTIET